jgi:hypothetical protein
MWVDQAGGRAQLGAFLKFVTVGNDIFVEMVEIVSVTTLYATESIQAWI